MTVAIVIGGEGFIGRHLCATLRARGVTVAMVGRPKPEAPPGDNVRRIDLMDKAAMSALFEQFPEADVYYLVANTRRQATADLSDTFDCVSQELLPLLSTLDAAAAAAHPPRIFVRAGSIAEYGASSTPCREDDMCRPLTIYGATLLAGTGYVNALASRLPFRVVTARLGLTYGRGQSTTFLAARLLRDLPRGRPVRIERPDDRRPMIHVDDTVSGLMAIAAAEAPPAIVNISVPESVTMRRLASLALEVMSAPHDLVTFGESAGQATSLGCETELARRALGWSPRIDLRNGLAQAAELSSVA